jgi:cysteinylglycine-S-conjugate dipeptidase
VTRVDALRERVRSLMPQARSDLAELVAFRSVADERQFPPEECERTARWILDALGAAGFPEHQAYEMPDGSNAVYGHVPGPPGAPTVLLYSHYDVQPPLNEEAWDTPPWELTEKDGRWYGRGAADCKGNVVAHLTALRALGDELPVGVKFIAEGSEEQASDGLERFVPRQPDLLAADAIVVADTGNVAAGVPTMTTSLRGAVGMVVNVRTLATSLHSGAFGGSAPDALAALVRMLASLHDDRGNTVVRGLDATRAWAGAEYPVEQFRLDAGVLDGVELLGDGEVADLLWARPAATVLGIDCPPVVGATASIQPEARALILLRIPPGTNADDAQNALAAHLRAVAPWGARVELERHGAADPFTGRVAGPAHGAMRAAMEEAYRREPVTAGQGGSIPLCNILQETYPEAEILLIGVEEPGCQIHAPNESVDPKELERLALVEALFLGKYAKMLSSSTDGGARP